MREDTKGFYEDQSKNENEELDSFINEINQGIEVKEEEIACGRTKDFMNIKVKMKMKN